MTPEPIPTDCLPFGGGDQKLLDLLRGTRTRLIAYCVAPDCRCLDRAGVIISSDAEAPRGYEVREEIIGGVCDGMTPAEVLADRDAFNRACGE